MNAAARPDAAASPDTGTALVPQAVTERGLWLRVAAPARDLPLVARSIPASDKVLAVLSAPAIFLEAVVGADLAAAIDLSQPLDLVAGLERAPSGLAPSREVAVTFGVDSSGVKRLPLKPLAAGRFAVNAAPGRMLRVCELWQLGAPLAQRLVCGTDAAALRKFGPEALHDAAKPTTAALRLELSGQPYRELIAHSMQNMQRDAARMPASQRGGYQAGAEWASAVLSGDGIGLDVALSPDTVDLGVDMSWDTSKNPLLGSWLAASARAPALPASYSALPDDSAVRGALAGVDGATGSALIRSAVAWFATLEQQEDGLTSDETAQITRATAGVLPERWRGVFALGRDLSAASGALAKGERLTATQLDAALRGWFVLGLDVDAAAYRRAIVDFQAVANLPEHSRVKKPAASSSSKLRLRPSPPKELPSGTLHLVDEVRPTPAFVSTTKTTALPRAHDNHILVVPDGTSFVWIVVAGSEKAATQRASALLLHKVTTPLPPLPAEPPLVLAGQFTLEGLIGQQLDWDSAEQRSRGRNLLQRTSALPAQGRSPIPFAATVRAAAGNSGSRYRMRGVVRLSHEALRDLIQYIAGDDAATPP